MFWDCSIVANFILDVEGRFLGKQYCFSKGDIYFGYGEGPSHPYDFLILHLKYYVYECKRSDRKPTVDEFFYKFIFALNIERYNNLRVQPHSKRKVKYADLQYAFAACPELFCQSVVLIILLALNVFLFTAKPICRYSH